MKPVLLVGAAAAAVIGIVAIAFAATSGGGGNNSAQSPTATATATPSETASSTPTSTATQSPPTATPKPTEPVATVPAPTVGPGTPIPSEPIFTVTPAPTQPSLPAGRHAEPAPIDHVEVQVAESFPPQYVVHILAGLPSGCVEQYTHSFTRDGNTINVSVLNSVPDGNPICTAIYGQYEVNIALGSDFTSGQTYEVDVNNGAATTQFTAQ